jgi:glutathione S-transferase
MKLYYARGACSLSPHIALREAGLDFDLDKVDLKNKLTADGGDFLAENPKGYVPALRLNSGDVLSEGVAIVLYIASLAPAAKLAPAAGTLDYYRLVEWLAFISSELHKGFPPLFHPDSPEAVKTQAREKLSTRFAYVDRILADRTFLTGDTFSVADGYLFTVLRWVNHVGMTLADWPSLTRFFEQVSARPAVRAALIAEGLLKN